MKLKLSKTQWQFIGKQAGWIKQAQEIEPSQTYEYFINMDERGEFRADVRDDMGNTILDIDESMFEDGFMKHKKDLQGLKDYMANIGLIVQSDQIVPGNFR